MVASAVGVILPFALAATQPGEGRRLGAFRSAYDEGKAHDPVRAYSERGGGDEKAVAGLSAQVELGQVGIVGVRRRRDILLNERRFFGHPRQRPLLLAARGRVARGLGCGWGGGARAQA